MNHSRFSGAWVVLVGFSNVVGYWHGLEGCGILYCRVLRTGCTLLNNCYIIVVIVWTLSHLYVVKYDILLLLICNLIFSAILSKPLLGRPQCGWSWARHTTWQGRYILVSELVAQLPSSPPPTSPYLSLPLGASRIEFGPCLTCGHKAESDAAKVLQCVRKLWFWGGLVLPRLSPLLFRLPCAKVQWVGNFGFQCSCSFASITSFLMGTCHKLRLHVAGKRPIPWVGGDGRRRAERQLRGTSTS